MAIARAVPCLGALALFAAPGFESRDVTASEPVWDERAVEHVLNRAAFGGRTTEIVAGVRAGRAAFVAALIEGGRDDAEPFLAREYRHSADETEDMSSMERLALKNEYCRQDQCQMNAYARWWLAEMHHGVHPLRERMALFWHGHFASSMSDVRSSAAMIRQNALFRTHALGSFRDLVAGILRDPAMLTYLDNTDNHRWAPNENLARELMELFTLGEGHYTERDVREAARALTGWHVRDGRFFVNEHSHDKGVKTVLGVTGRLDGDDLTDVLLAHPACARWVAGKLLEYFEGLEPTPARREDYAGVLRENDYGIAAFLEHLLMDPAFYADEVVGTRIAGPVDYLVGSARRLDVQPSPVILAVGSAVLGQSLFRPPNVKGWTRGRAWITTSSFQQRGNLAATLLGVGPADSSSARVAMAPKNPEISRLSAIEQVGWRPVVDLTGRCTHAQVERSEDVVDFLCAELLAVPVSDRSRASMVEFLDAERTDDESAGAGADGERALRRLAHLILSLPEAQLN